MFKSLKICLIILGLGVFVLPKQILYAQKTEQCCEQKTNKDDCCKTEDSKPCHPEESEKKDCKKDCSNCHSCSVSFVLNYISPEIYSPSQKHFFSEKNNFNYEIAFFFSNIHNIWQPPKIG